MSTDRASSNPVPVGIRVAQLSDCLDEIGLRGQCLPPEIMPIDRSMNVVGRAFTVSARLVDAVPEARYAGLLEALDNLGTGHIYTITAGGDTTAALWGELLATSARARLAVGALTDGSVRDMAQLIGMDFPTFATGTTPADIHGRYEVDTYGDPIVIGGVRIEHGDLVAGDIDGVVIVPKSVEADVIALAADKMAGESDMRDVLAGGVLPSRAFAEYGVL